MLKKSKSKSKQPSFSLCKTESNSFFFLFFSFHFLFLFLSLSFAVLESDTHTHTHTKLVDSFVAAFLCGWLAASSICIALARMPINKCAMHHAPYAIALLRFVSLRATLAHLTFGGLTGSSERGAGQRECPTEPACLLHRTDSRPLHGA